MTAGGSAGSWLFHLLSRKQEEGGRKEEKKERMIDEMIDVGRRKRGGETKVRGLMKPFLGVTRPF